MNSSMAVARALLSDVGVERQVVSFPEGLIGLPQAKRFCIEASEEIRPLLRMNSVDDSGLSFLVIDPHLVLPDYRPTLPAPVAGSFEVSGGPHPAVLAIVSLGPQLEQCSVNLLAPLVIDPRSLLGVQMVLETGAYPIRHPVLSPSP